MDPLDLLLLGRAVGMLPLAPTASFTSLRANLSRDGVTQINSLSEEGPVPQGSSNSPSENTNGQETGPSGKDAALAKTASQFLTTEALAAQNTISALERWDKEEEKRIDRLDAAAYSLGFDLPRHCFQNEKWELDAWLDSPPTARQSFALQHDLCEREGPDKSFGFEESLTTVNKPSGDTTAGCIDNVS